MPILDPTLQYHLLNRTPPKEETDQLAFYLRYLRIASRNVNFNFSTIEASMQFKKDLKASIQLLNNKFKCNVDKTDLNNPSIKNYYNYLFLQISKLTNFNSKTGVKVEGNYFIQEGLSSTKFFQPKILYQRYHSWYFSDTPIAILCLDLTHENPPPEFLQLLLLEIDLMSAAGFTLVLSLNYKPSFNEYVFDLIERNQFSEIHLNASSSFYISNFFTFISKTPDLFIKRLDSFKVYLYIYCPIISNWYLSQYIYKTLKQSPRISFFVYSYDLKVTLKQINFEETPIFAYCKVGFKYEKILIRLSNVPIYDNEDETINFTPSNTSDVSMCLISKSDFLNWNNRRVKAVFYVDENRHSFEKYIDFDDIHLVRNDLYVTDTLQLANIDEETLKKIKELKKQVRSMMKTNHRSNKKLKRPRFKSLKLDESIKNDISYLTYAYITTRPENIKFNIHRSQLYTILQSSKFLLKQESFSRRLLLKQKKRYEQIINSNNFDDVLIVDDNDALYNEVKELLSGSSLNKKIKDILKVNFSLPNNYDDKSSSKKSPSGKTQKMLKDAKDKLNKINEKLGSMSGSEDSKGVIYQVETGEGKSCIISIIAANLAKSGKTVHITSSSIKLSNRDYIDSFEFFNAINVKTAVLLHDNEFPYAKFENRKQRSNSFINKSNSSISINKSNSTISINSSNSSFNLDDANSSSSNIREDESLDNLFKDNADNYYQTYTQADNNLNYSRYYDNPKFDYYNEKQFRNPSRMNFSVCGLDCDNNIPDNKPSIIFSTFTNFECFYLKMLEVCPGYVDEYFSNCVLLIDEADSILIDEIANGTIVSKEMRSNTKEILTFVYHNKKKDVPALDTYNKIMEKWPKNVDLKLKDVERMYSEIDLINQDKFREGVRYSIEEYEVRNEKKKKKLLDQTINVVKDISTKAVKGLIKELSKGDDENEEEEDEDEDDDDDDDDDGEEEDEDDDSPVTVFRHIVPYDCEHKGILEPNKEFSGFIQQFIAIKESEENNVTNMIIKDMSMSYLYVSHPIFVKLYGKVCGFTGTIGNKTDKKIYKEQYGLTTLKVPRYKANLRVEFPTILCNSFTERNRKIVSEVIEFQKKGNPVLVIFQDSNEISDVGNLLNMKGIKYYNVFNGKNEKVTPELVAGQESSVSLGTNVCGRGTNIISEGKPLHVIISYYTSNIRVINQALGRTARKGQKGTSRIICVKQQYLYPTLFNENGIDAVIEEFRIKDQLQSEYIELFKKIKPWIFQNDIKKDTGKLKFSDEDIKTLRDARINVNRIVAYKYKFPIKMTIDTFLSIQAQKIFSIANCPNCKYTWELFQRYVREMVLESWSLMINNIDDTFFEMEENKEYKKESQELKETVLDINSNEYLDKVLKINKKFENVFDRYEKEIKKQRIYLLMAINNYLPIDAFRIQDSFMFIFRKILDKYQTNVLKSFKTISDKYLSINKTGFLTCHIGFKPFALLTESGARINYKNLNKTNYIKDPEMRYLKKRPNNKLSLLSITEKIDDIFNQIFKKINELLGSNTFLKFFLRRTLSGWEFGICFDISVENKDDLDPNCLVDKDPLLLFTICVKSVAPILAGILIIFLVYLASIAKDISQWITGFPAKLSEEIVKKGIFVICEIVSKELIDFTLNKFIDFLKGTLEKQLGQIRNEKAANIIDQLKTLFESGVGEHLNSKLSGFFDDKIKVNLKWQKALKNSFDPQKILTISIYLLLCFASFMLNFSSKNEAIENAQNDSIQYNECLETKFEANYNDNEEEAESKENVMDDKIWLLADKDKNEVSELRGEKLIDSDSNDDKEKVKAIGKKFEEFQKSFLYKFKNFNPLSMFVKLTEFIDDHKEEITDTVNLAKDIKYCILNKGKMTQRCERFEYNGFKNILLQQVRIYSTNKFPSILNLVGYSVKKKKQYLFVENKGNGTLEDLINNQVKIDKTHKLIIAYGTACAIEALHKNRIIHRNLKPCNISLDSNYYPYLSDFFYATQVDSKLPYLVTETTIEFMAPEFIKDYKSNQCSFMLDVYSYGIVLFMIANELNPFKDCSENVIRSNTENGIRPEFVTNVDEKWKNLIIKCWSQDPSQRPNFTQICDTLENDLIDDSIDVNTFNTFKNMINRDHEI